MPTSGKDFKSRIVTLALAIVFMAGLIMGAAVLWNYDRITRNILQSRVAIEAEIISKNIATSVLFDDTATAEEIIATFSADPAVLHVDLRNERGLRLAVYNNPPQDNDDSTVFQVWETITFDGKKIGTLNVIVSKSELYQKNFEIILFLSTILCLVLIVAYGLARPMIKSLVVPLLNLHATSEKIAQTRDYSLRVAVQSEDEVGRLSRMFNYMVEQIEHRDVMLEKQVSQRTNELEKLAEQFRHRAFHDSLTGLPNRALLNEHFEMSIEQARRKGHYFACLLLDLDDFKAINDTKGHEFGDALLIEVAVRLQTTVRGVDMVCRLGGDEFVVILNDLTNLEDIEVVAGKILEQVNREFFIKDEIIRTAVSIGGAVFPDHGDNVSTLKRHADVAMYRAKDAGKNQFCLFSEGMQEEVKYRLMIQSGLRPALDEQQFEIYVQPKVDPVIDKVVGCEALVRWNHPQEGFLTPNKFIPYAEEVGLIAEIDYFVIRDCCRKTLEWTEIFNRRIPIAFNLSGRHFHDYKIVEVLRSSIAEFAIDPSLLEVEITEAVLIEDPEKAQKIVKAVKALGIGISLDDFGTGYSSLNYLRTLPIDTVKLDRSFVANIDTNSQDRRLTRGIVSLAQGLGLKLVAEGVEHESQRDALIELGCTTMQGYFFLPPASHSNFLQWYLKRYSPPEAEQSA